MSYIRLELSVMNGYPFSIILRLGRPPICFSLSRTIVLANLWTSMGIGRVKALTYLEESAEITSFGEADVTIFSFSNAPPPPLIMLRLESTWSAPSNTILISLILVSSLILKLSSSATIPICNEVGMNDKESFIEIIPISLTIWVTALPLPNPMVMFFLMYLFTMSFATPDEVLIEVTNYKVMSMKL